MPWSGPSECKDFSMTRVVVVVVADGAEVSIPSREAEFVNDCKFIKMGEIRLFR